MAASKFLNLIALLALAILACSFVATPANAISIDTSHNMFRRDHAVLAKKKRSTSTKRCKPRSSTPTSNPSPPPPKKDDLTTSVTSSTAAPSKSSSSETPSNTGSSGSDPVKGGKVGIAWSSGDDPALAKWAKGQASCVYTWSAFLPSNTHGLQGIPMLWGPTKLSDFEKLVKQGYATIAMGFNEPDIKTQSNLDPGTAASLWQQHMNPLKKEGYYLLSPATVTGTKWMEDFLAACDGKCEFDAIAMHWYGTKFDDLKTSLNAYHNKFGKDIWLTEFACQSFSNAPQCDTGEVWALMNSAKAFAESTDWLAKIFWFGAMHDMDNVNPLNQLMDSSGAPNALGNAFLN